MTTPDAPNPILEAARKLQERKLAAVQDVIDSRTHIATVQRQLANAERLDALAYAKAVKAGWSEDELRQVGIVPPSTRAPGRPRSSRSRNGSGNAPVDTHGAPQDSPMEAEEHLRAARIPTPAFAS